MRIIPHLSDTLKGIILIITGSILLAYTLGFTPTWLYNVVLFGSIAMIIIGLFMVDAHKKLMRLIKKQEQPPHEPPEF